MPWRQSFILILQPITRTTCIVRAVPAVPVLVAWWSPWSSPTSDLQSKAFSDPWTFPLAWIRSISTLSPSPAHASPLPLQATEQRAPRPRTRSEMIARPRIEASGRNEPANVGRLGESRQMALGLVRTGRAPKVIGRKAPDRDAPTAQVAPKNRATLDQAAAAALVRHRQAPGVPQGRHALSVPAESRGCRPGVIELLEFTSTIHRVRGDP